MSCEALTRFAARTPEAGYHIAVIRSAADAIRDALLAAAGLDARAALAPDDATQIRARLRPIMESAAARDGLMARVEARGSGSDPASVHEGDS